MSLSYITGIKYITAKTEIELNVFVGDFLLHNKHLNIISDRYYIRDLRKYGVLLHMRIIEYTGGQEKFYIEN